jgi:hypothetical protein
VSDDNIRKQVAGRLGLEDDGQEISFSPSSLLASMGGRLGIVEAVLPTILFISVFSFTSDGLAAVIAAASASVVFLLIRLFTRGMLTQVVVGGAGVAIAAFLALREGGQTQDYFLIGFYTNAAYASVLLISILIRQPLLGVAVALLTGNKDWKSRPSLKYRFYLVTALWVGFFSLRLAVQLPLYFAGAVEALATARLVMGAPLYALLLVASWLILKAVFLQKR